MQAVAGGGSNHYQLPYPHLEPPLTATRFCPLHHFKELHQKYGNVIINM